MQDKGLCNRCDFLAIVERREEAIAMTTHAQSLPLRTSSRVAHRHVVISTQGIGKWFAESPIASFFRTFAAVMLGLTAADWATAAHIGFTDWRTWLIGALAAAVPVIARALNLDDTAFGSVKAK
jgi:hypothetical protein